jgi:uncharacterized protein YdiU (UPF0061 family)
LINKNTNTGWNLDNSYSQLPKIFFTSLNPTPVSSPKLVILNNKFAESLGFNLEYLKSEHAIDIFAGNKVPNGSFPIAQAYAGHQFGYFTILGDGRAILLGEQITPFGDRFDIQLKGSGATPYSRRGDGRASLGPMLREYIISEAMHALKIPTTRSLAVVTTGEDVYRETIQRGAILTRVASSHLRVGTFEFAANKGSVEELKALADYAIQRHYKSIKESENKYLLLLNELAKRQAELIAMWQHVGFIHGVMNTDNMTISGETIDYGPCAFMDSYDPKTVFSSIDENGRYAYGNQPMIAAWNLARFSESILPLLHDNREKAVELAQDVINNYNVLFEQNYMLGMRAKLGIFNEGEQDDKIVEDLLSIMQKYNADYTNTFYELSKDNEQSKDINQGSDMYKSVEFIKWHETWQSRLDRQEESRVMSKELMQKSNHIVIPRNHRVEEALEAAVNNDDYSIMNNLLEALSEPYNYKKVNLEYLRVPQNAKTPYRTFCGT